MNSKILLKYKKTYLWQLFYSFFNLKGTFFAIITLVLCTIGLSAFFGSSLKLATPFLFAIGVIFYIKYQELLLSFFLVALFSFQIINPGKYYEQELLGTSQITNILSFDSGRFVSFGVNLTLIFLIICVTLLVADVFNKERSKEILNAFINERRLIVVSFVGFIVSGVGTSIIFSPFTALSTIWTLQYSQLFIIGFIFYYLWKLSKDNAKIVNSVFVATLLIQTAISLGQFVKQSTIGIPIEVYNDKQFYYGSDEISSLSRVVGTFYYPIEYAFISNLIICFLLPTAFKKSKITTLAVICGYLCLVLTQSRSGWISAFLVFIFYYYIYLKHNIKILLQNISKKSFIYLAMIITIPLSFVVIPRIMVSANFYRDNGGWELRSKMFKEGWESFYNSPWFGFGAGTNEVVLNSYFPDGVSSVFPLPILFAPLQMLLEFGVVGFLFFLLPTYLIIRRLVNKISRRLVNKISNSTAGISEAFTFSFISAILVTIIHYSFQNHYGVVEFTYLGMVFGAGLIATET